MCRQNSRPCVTAEEAVGAEECLLLYCKPVELYNIIQRRAQLNPMFLSRCLDYKIEAKWKIGSKDRYVIFNYRDQNNLLRKTEVTRNFSCPFCLMRCGSFKGLRCHLSTSHDLFQFEFWTSEEYRAVNVSVRTDTLCSETIAGEPELYLQSFCHWSKLRKRKRPENPLDRGKNIFPHVLESVLPPLAAETLHRGSLEISNGERVPGSFHRSKEFHNERHLGETFCSYENGISNGMDCVAPSSNQGIPVARAQSVEVMDRSVPATLRPIAKSRKLSLEHTESRSFTLLQKRQFYHSHRAQPMTLEQVLSDRDSEDEIDDGISDLEDRRMLDDFVDVSSDEKHLMHLWNSFIRKQRVLADGHVSWACVAFLRLHGKLLVQSDALFWGWKLFVIKLWNHGLIDPVTMDNCSILLENMKNEAANAETWSNTSNPEQ